MKQKPLVGIMMGSDSDLAVMKEAAEVLDMFRIPNEIKVISAHRTPYINERYASKAHKRGMKVIIAGAGGAAHLPGVTAAYTPLPVIGVPIKTKTLNGMDSLLSIVQMPYGVPVATVAIDNAKNAGVLAAMIIAVGDKKLQKKILDFKAKIAKESINKNKKLASKLKSGT